MHTMLKMQMQKYFYIDFVNKILVMNFSVIINGIVFYTSIRNICLNITYISRNTVDKQFKLILKSLLINKECLMINYE